MLATHCILSQSKWNMLKSSYSTVAAVHSSGSIPADLNTRFPIEPNLHNKGIQALEISLVALGVAVWYHNISI